MLHFITHLIKNGNAMTEHEIFIDFKIAHDSVRRDRRKPMIQSGERCMTSH